MENKQSTSTKQANTMDNQELLKLGDIIKHTGDFGLFQVLLFAFTTFSLGVLNWSMMTMAFTASVPDWKCYGFSTGENQSEMRYESNVCKVNGTACHRIVFAEDMSTAVSEWNLVCDLKWVSQTMTTIQMAGLLAGALFWGHVSDGIGRKPTFYLNILLLGIFNLVSYFSVNWVMFAAMRCGIGFSCAGFMVSVVYFEYIRNKWRVYLYLVPGWAVWASLMALFCWRVHDWHYIHLVITVMAVLILMTWCVVPESFRWLACNGRTEEAERAIRYVAKINRKPAPSLKQLQAVLEAEQQEAEQTKALQVYSVLDLFRTSRIRKTTLLFSLIWLFSAFSYYGIAFAVQELSGNLYLNLLLLSLADIPGYYLLVLFNTWGGRRWTCVGFYFVGGLFALAVGVLKYTDANVGAVVINVFALLSKLWVSAAWDLNTLWSTESFPTVVRYIGAGFVSSISRVGSMVAPQIITLGMDVPGLLYIISGIVCVLSCVLCIFLEETKNRDLADLIPAKSSKATSVEEGEKHIQIKSEEVKQNGVGHVLKLEK